MFTHEAISGKTFRRLTKEKATLAREIDKRKNCWNFAWLEEDASVPVSWKRIHEHSMYVGDCIDSKGMNKVVLYCTLIEIDLPRKAYSVL